LNGGIIVAPLDRIVITLALRRLRMPPAHSNLSSWRCFSPTLGIFTGIFLGWVIHFYLPSELDVVVDLAARSLDLIVALVGWAIGTALYGMRIHCGGSKRATKEERGRYVDYALFLLVPLILAPIFLVTGSILLYYIDALLLLAMICGEIKSGKPFWFITGL